MAELELYGKCKELGYCDCGGFFGCIGTPALALVECSVCDRSHSPEHPHIKNIDGDVPIDDAELEETRPTLTEIPRQLPDWLKDKPGAVMIGRAPHQSLRNYVRSAASRGRPGMPARSRRTPGIAFNGRIQAICDVCGKVKRSNHNCKGAAENDRIARGRPKAVIVQAGGIDVTVAGQSFQVTKLTADGLKRIKQRKAPSKYQEILDLLMTLDVGEAILVPRGKVSADGLRAQARKLS